MMNKTQARREANYVAFIALEHWRSNGYVEDYADEKAGVGAGDCGSCGDCGPCRDAAKIVKEFDAIAQRSWEKGSQ